MKEIIAKAEKSFRKASLRDHRMKVVNLVKVNTLSMQWPVPNLVQLYYASVVKSPFKSYIVYYSAIHVLQISRYLMIKMPYCYGACHIHCSGSNFDYISLIAESNRSNVWCL